MRRFAIIIIGVGLVILGSIFVFKDAFGENIAQTAESVAIKHVSSKINDSLKEPNPIEEMEEDTVVSLAFDKEKLYKNMVDAKAEWLYELPQWDNIFSEEKRKELITNIYLYFQLFHVAKQEQE